LSIWLVRHAPVAVSGICYGQSDVAVTLDPVEAASRIATYWDRMELPAVREVWTSPWSRCHEVARALADGWQLQQSVDARLSELNFGRWEGLSYDEIRACDGERFARWVSSCDTLSPPEGETASDLMTRVGTWLEERENHGPLLAVTHAGVIRAARAITKAAPYAAVACEAVDHVIPERFLPALVTGRSL
jgi:alpha-ribazole phosphatase